MMDRRKFIGAGLGLAAAAMAGKALAKKSGQLQILILGGTGFLGPQVVYAALAGGHQVTLFNRGKTNPDMFSDLETILGDRDGDLSGLHGRHWDAVVDTSGYVPRVVGDSAGALAGSVDRYLFVSSVSVYASLGEAGIEETAFVGTLSDPATETVDGDTYGPLKALCEHAVNEVFGDRATVIRPGLIAGPGDRTDRFTYWPVRLARGGEVLAPGDGRDPVQVIDVRDLGQWMIHCLEQDIAGTYNACSPRGELDMASMLNACQPVPSASLHWADSEFLAARQVEPWSDMPAWVPRGSEFAGVMEVSSARAQANGLNTRPVARTARDTLAWFEQTRGLRDALRAGLSPQREQELLASLDAPPADR